MFSNSWVLIFFVYLGLLAFVGECNCGSSCTTDDLETGVYCYSTVDEGGTECVNCDGATLDCNTCNCIHDTTSSPTEHIKSQYVTIVAVVAVGCCAVVVLCCICCCYSCRRRRAHKCCNEHKPDANINYVQTGKTGMVIIRQPGPVVLQQKQNFQEPLLQASTTQQGNYTQQPPYNPQYIANVEGQFITSPVFDADVNQIEGQ